MKESRLYLHFFKTYVFVLFVPAVFGLIAGIWLFSRSPELFVSERLFEFPYTYEDAAAVEKQSEEAVTVLRSLQLKEELGMQQTAVTVFKPGPFAVKLQIKNLNPETSVHQLAKLSGYFLQSYPVREIGTEVTFIEKGSLLKFLVLGLAAGIGSGLIFSLVLAYFKRF